MIGWQQDADGVVVLTMDDPQASVNTLNDRYVAAMGSALDRLEASLDTVTGVVIVSAKRSFSVGADLDTVRGSGPDDAAALSAFVTEIKQQFRRLERLGKPVVAAMAGSAFGGGLELALSTHYRVAVDASSNRYGLPEVTLGLIPGAGGLTRTVRMLGLQRALAEVILPGTRFRPAAALELGLLDELVPSPSHVVPAAKAWIAAHPAAAQPWDEPGYRIPGSADAGLAVLPAALRSETKGAPAPAARAALAAAVEGSLVPLDTALAVETRYFVQLLTSRIAQNLIGAFFADRREVSSGGSRPPGVPRSTVTRLGVVGAGMMGAGIAYAAAQAGIEVVLQDVTAEAAERGKARVAALEARAQEKGRTTATRSAELLGRIRTTGSLADLAEADIVVEAVFESMELKQQVFGQLDAALPAGVVLGSNTSTLPIGEIAGAVARPEAVVGIHFFSPVHRMPLVEIVRGQHTSDEAVARAFDLVLQLGKTPIVVADARGFFTSRVIMRYLAEAIAAVGEGVPPASIEQAALQAGYPTGPLQLVDELTLTLTRQIREEARAAALAAGREWVAHPSEAVLDRLVELGRHGRSTGGGFYDYDPSGVRVGLWAGLGEFAGSTAAGSGPDGFDSPVPFADLQERMLFAEALEAVHCLDEGVLGSAADANLGSILGIGFPSWTGGVLRYIDQYEGGVAGFVARARALASRYGPHFEPPASMLSRTAPYSA